MAPDRARRTSRRRGGSSPTGRHGRSRRHPGRAAHDHLIRPELHSRIVKCLNDLRLGALVTPIRNGGNTQKSQERSNNVAANRGRTPRSHLADCTQRTNPTVGGASDAVALVVPGHVVTGRRQVIGDTTKYFVMPDDGSACRSDHQSTTRRTTIGDTSARIFHSSSLGPHALTAL